MRKEILFLGVFSLLLLTGCGSKQYFAPEKTYGASGSSSVTIRSFSRDGATLEDGRVLTKKSISTATVQKGFNFINATKGGMITANKKGDCQLIVNGGAEKSVKFSKALVAGTIVGQKLVYLLQNNSFGIYDLTSNKIVYNNKSEKVFSIDTRIANPYQIDNLIVVPTLSGKLSILDLSTLKLSKEVYVSTESTLNNVIFLNRIGNSLISATPHRVISYSKKGKREFDRAISEVIISGNFIFIFAKDGQVSQLDESMKVLNEKKFKFAHFSIAGIVNEKIYAMDKQGLLVVSNKELTKHKVYNLPEVEGYSFISGGKLYYDGRSVELTALGYE
ncbi:MAG: hypothetical protein KAG56_10405 [Sulfurovaceae bacterium]|nr:hypothetical protein [Sulfurovaceae bacterium]